MLNKCSGFIIIILLFVLLYCKQSQRTDSQLLFALNCVEIHAIFSSKKHINSLNSQSNNKIEWTFDFPFELLAFLFLFSLAAFLIIFIIFLLSAYDSCLFAEFVIFILFFLLYFALFSL